MSVRFDILHMGQSYSRPTLAAMWGYSSYQALARGVVTPRDDNKIILFVTRDKQDFQEPYRDSLAGDLLLWEGPTDHFAEERMLASSRLGDEIHVFYRDRHHSDFIYEGQFTVVAYERRTDGPSSFRLRRV